MANLKYKISVATVTYGNRWVFLSRVIERLLASELVYKVIVVNNASDYNIQSKVKALNDNRVIVIEHEENEGSAAGYKAGIAYAVEQTETDFLWLLDDDNLPEEDALEELVNTWDEIGANPISTALYCLRPDRKDHVKIAKGEDPYRYYLVPDNFLGFNIFRIPYNQYLKIADKFKGDKKFKKTAPIPYVPYGGLFLHRDLVNIIGYPNAGFFVYVDDSEYTYRITQHGGTILLVSAAGVNDIDKSQGTVYVKKSFHSHYLDQWGFRIYYHVRNRVYFYKKVSLKNRFVFSINKFLFMLWLKGVSIISSKKTEYQKLKIAVSEGLNNQLGKVGDDKF